MSRTIRVDVDGNPTSAAGCCVLTLDDDVLDRILDAARKGYVEVALCHAARALCDVHEPRLFDVTISEQQHVRIVEALLSNGDSLAAVNDMLTWLDRGPNHQGDTT